MKIITVDGRSIDREDVAAILSGASFTARLDADARERIVAARDAVEKGIAEGTFAEWAESYGHLYGTPAAALEEALSAGRVIVLDIDVQGARQVRERFSDAVLIFIRPPDMTTLTDRLRRRRTESEEQFRVRLERARAELASASMYHHVIVNDDLERAAVSYTHLRAHET